MVKVAPTPEGQIVLSALRLYVPLPSDQVSASGYSLWFIEVQKESGCASDCGTWLDESIHQTKVFGPYLGTRIK